MTTAPGTADPTSRATPLTIDGGPEVGHPVRSFVLVVVGLALLLAALGLTGAVAPQLTSRSSAGSSGGPGQRTEQVVHVRSGSVLPVRIVGAGFVAPGWSDVRVRVVDDPSRAGALGEPFAPLEVDGGGVWLAVSGVPDCGGTTPSTAIAVRARTWLGSERTLRFADDVGGGWDYCDDPST